MIRTDERNEEKCFRLRGERFVGIFARHVAAAFLILGNPPRCPTRHPIVRLARRGNDDFRYSRHVRTDILARRRRHLQHGRPQSSRLIWPRPRRGVEIQKSIAPNRDEIDPRFSPADPQKSFAAFPIDSLDVLFRASSRDTCRHQSRRPTKSSCYG